MSTEPTSAEDEGVGTMVYNERDIHEAEARGMEMMLEQLRRFERIAAEDFIAAHRAGGQ